MTKQSTLTSIDFGQRIAEEEGETLSSYFVETDNWIKVYNGDVDVIYGPKGSGKSALYSLLVAKADSLIDKNIILVPAENPRGTPAFRELATDPPASENEFVSLWKLYFLALLSASFKEYGIEGEEAEHIRRALAAEGLEKERLSLQGLIQGVYTYVKNALRPPAAVEGTVHTDPATQLPIGYTGRISFSEPSIEARRAGVESVNSLLEKASRALSKNGRYKVWILLDRLDVAFVESSDLEKNALRALFRVYLDLMGFDNIRPKIFLRTDIWNRITSEGFREASHITKHVTISWNRAALLNLIIKRAIKNHPLLNHYQTTEAEVLNSTESQEAFFYRVFPDQVDRGPSKPSTLDWLISRTRDGAQATAPRELIHLLSSLRTQQIRRYEVGEPDPDGEPIFSRAAFKEALPEVSEVRLTQTLYAEYPDLRVWIERLRGEKTSQRPETLARIWGNEVGDAVSLADTLVNVGFFEKRGTKELPEYWVPFLYRDGLDLLQGSAD